MTDKPGNPWPLLPIAGWLSQYRRGWLRFDLLAGATLAAYAVPVSLAYAGLAGLPPQTGLYCYLVAGLGYAVLGSSRHIAVGPTSAIALLLGVTLAPLSGGDPARHAALASLTALIVAGVFVLAWLLRLSVLVSFISESILTGFKAGAALVIASTQLPKLFGVDGGGGDFFHRIGHLVRQLPDTNLPTLGVGVAALAALAVGGKFLPGRPVALGVVVLALVAASLVPVEQQGVKVVGRLTPGLPDFLPAAASLGDLRVDEVRQLTRLAFACFLLAYIESVSAARAFALKHRYPVDPRQEFLGLGAASLVAGLWQGFPVAGGLSQSAVNEKGGARTPLSLVVASAVVGLVLLLFTDLFRNLPEAVLAAIVLVAVAGLIDLKELRYLWRASRIDFAAAGVALGGVLLMGVLDGVVIAVLASAAMLLFRVTRPHVAFLGRIPGTERFSDATRHPDNEAVPGVLAFRVEGSLVYFNADHVLQTVLQRVGGEPGLRRVVYDLSNTPYVDVAGSRMLRRLHDELAAKEIGFRLVGAHGEVRDRLRFEKLEEWAGPINRHVSLGEAVDLPPEGTPGRDERTNPEGPPHGNP
ncbi:SulP family inorganic anion transporter [Urbifossiella limnaea]|uniref:Putative sulfate transporter n=1 Tax=Urbifossiella limnaea TaxID=2528023 RepID=A0A517Y188_9BACT|nr:sulfate permease [Urbifossiella limnaea]QDU23527.1 putative sulfate transporter [Urbifossiella limnaea]